MILEKIPLVPDTSDQVVAVTLGDNPYRLRVMWNERFGYWSLSIYTAASEPILEGIKMVTNYDLTGRFKDLRLPYGQLYFVREKGSVHRPDYTDLAVTHNLYYHEPDAEVTAQPVYGVTGGFLRNIVLPQIHGVASVGSVLTVEPGLWLTEPPPALTYRWKANHVVIESENLTLYIVRAGDDGKSITCSETAINTNGESSKDSNAIVIGGAGIAPVCTVAPVVTGNGSTVGSTLTSTEGTWTGSPTPTIARQWKEDGVPIFGAVDLQYSIRSYSEGKVITCVETAVNTAGTILAESNETLVVHATPPVNIVPVAIAGQGAEGALLSVVPGTWEGNPSPSLTYQWKEDGVAIPGATSTTYQTSQGDADKTLTCVETGSNSEGNASYESNAIYITENAAPINTVPVTISAEAGVGVGSVLTAEPGLWTGAPLPVLTYQWMAGANEISGATGLTFTITSNELGASITCVETGTNQSGSVSVASNAIEADYSPRVLYGNGEVGFWLDPSDLSTMWRYHSAQRPVIANGNEIQVMLDKSKGLALGPEQIVAAADRDFSSDTGFWTKAATCVIENGVFKANGAAASINFLYKTTFPYLESYGVYEISFDLTIVSGDGVKVVYGTQMSDPITTAGRVTLRAYRLSDSSIFGIQPSGATEFTGTIDNLTIKNVAGNHFIQQDQSKRMAYGTDGALHWLMLQASAIDHLYMNPMPDELEIGGNLSIFVAGMTTNAVSTQKVILQADNASSTGYYKLSINYVGMTDAPVNFYTREGTTIDSYTTNTAKLDYSQPYTITVNRAMAESSIRVNGIQESFAQAAVPLPTTATKLFIGSSTVAAQPYDQRLYGIILRDEKSTASEIAKTEAWLELKAGA